MRPVRTTLCTLGSILLAGSTIDVARAEGELPPECLDPILNSCDADRYAAIKKTAYMDPAIQSCRIEQPQGYGPLFKACVAETLAPPEPELICTEGASVLCEAWPQGAEITYAWTVSGDFLPPVIGAPTTPMLVADCAPGRTTGRITVLVAGPLGAATTATTLVNCTGDL